MLGKLHVIKAGPLTLLHDLGRYGFSHFGITLPALSMNTPTAGLTIYSPIPSIAPP